MSIYWKETCFHRHGRLHSQQYYFLQSMKCKLSPRWLLPLLIHALHPRKAKCFLETCSGADSAGGAPAGMLFMILLFRGDDEDGLFLEEWEYRTIPSTYRSWVDWWWMKYNRTQIRYKFKHQWIPSYMKTMYLFKQYYVLIPILTNSNSRKAIHRPTVCELYPACSQTADHNILLSATYQTTMPKP